MLAVAVGGGGRIASSGAWRPAAPWNLVPVAPAASAWELRADSAPRSVELRLAQRVRTKMEPSALLWRSGDASERCQRAKRAEADLTAGT